MACIFYKMPYVFFRQPYVGNFILGMCCVNRILLQDIFLLFRLINMQLL